MENTDLMDQLRKISREQQCRFAWTCAVRALPFLASKGHFSYWSDNKRNKHIFAIFYTLDIAAYAARVDAHDEARAAAKAAYARADAYARAAYAAADDARPATYAARATYTRSSLAARAAAYAAARAAAYAAAYVAADDARAYDAVYAAADAAVRAAADAAADTSNFDLNSYYSVIREDLQTIISRGRHKVSIGIYGNIWHRFKNALAKEGCSYWGNLYEYIFNNNFVLDEETLRRRLNVPKEIRNQGAAKVATFLMESEKGTQRLNEARVIVLGDKGVGKTCIARRLINPSAPMTKESESTAGVDTSFWHLKKENVNVRIWDFAGHVITHSVHQFFLSERSLYLIVYDGRTDNKDRLEYWLNHIKNYGESSEAIILINKRDPHPASIPINSLKERYPICGVYTFSIKDDRLDLVRFRKVVSNYITSNPSWNRQIIPESYYRVKETLEARFIKRGKKKGEEYITREDFDEIASEYGVPDGQELLQDLHYLGVSLWYADMAEFNTLILNPEWISYGVYRIINWLRGKKRHALTLTDLEAVFEGVENRFPSEKFTFLFTLIKYYELAYETEDGNSLIFPCLLDEDRPAQLPDFPVDQSLALRYEADQPLLPNTISRFIVRHNQEIKTEQGRDIVWKLGVVLEDKGGLAIVREDISGNSITVSVKGENKTSYLSTLRATLNNIFEEYKNEKPALMYRIKRFGEIPGEIEPKPLWLTDRKILNHHALGKSYLDDETGLEIHMDGPINIYNIKADTAILGGQRHQIFKNTFNFLNCNIDLQGNLNELAQLLAEAGSSAQFTELQNMAKAMESVEDYDQPKVVRKTGIVNRLKGLVEELENEDSSLHKTVKSVKRGVEIAQSIAKKYNDIAQWVGLPTVPFLNL